MENAPLDVPPHKSGGETVRRFHYIAAFSFICISHNDELSKNTDQNICLYLYLYITTIKVYEGFYPPIVGTDVEVDKIW